MHDFKRSNKVTGVYWIKGAVDNIKIKAKLSHHNGVMSLPKFEDYTKDTNSVNLDNIESITEYVFNWQDKVFSLWEVNRYSDVHNCTTDTELSYNNLLKNSETHPSKIFTYKHDDYCFPLPFGNRTEESNILEMTKCFERLNLNEKITNFMSLNQGSQSHLFRSDENLGMKEDYWRAMHIVFDNSEYNEDNQLIFKQEAVLLSLFYNTVNNCLLVSPDCNELEMSPYSVETTTGLSLPYEYSVEIIFEEEEDSGEELTMLLTKLIKKWEKNHKHSVSFSLPPLGKKVFQVAFEIVSAKEFELDDLYIEFNIKLPEEVQCANPLNGRTIVAKSLKYDESQQWNFGHLVELNLEMDRNTDPSALQLFLEVISTDWWGRHRTEGYSYLPLTLEPGYYKKTLSCSRPEEMDRVEAESRRFFVGGCHLIKDLCVLAKPQLQDANFVYRSTGKVLLRWHIMSQSPIPGYTRSEESIPPSTSASAILQGAETVLRQYRKARAKLAAATKDLGGQGDGSDG